MITIFCVTFSVTSSVAAGQGGLAMLETVSLSVAVPLPVNVAPELELPGSAIVTGPLTTDQVGVPLVALPASVNGVVSPAAQVTWSGPASEVGLPLTASTTSSVAVGQGGLAVLTTVIRRVAVPVPVNVTPELRLLGSAIVAGPLITDQVGVPLVALPATVNGVVDPAAHRVWSSPASAAGLPFTTSTTSSVADGQGGLAVLATVSRRVAVPVPVSVTPEVRLPGLAIVAGPLTTDQVGVPLVALPASVNGVVAPAAHWV